MSFHQPFLRVQKAQVDASRHEETAVRVPEDASDETAVMPRGGVCRCFGERLVRIAELDSSTTKPLLHVLTSRSDRERGIHFLLEFRDRSRVERIHDSLSDGT